ncbi:MAG: ABC transporter permease [Candidatus Hydrogenedentota bacterium]
MTDSFAPIEKSPGFWRVAWRRYRTHKLGMIGLAIVLSLFATGFFAPILANDDPIATRYEGKWYFPAVIETIRNIPLASLVIKKDKPFRYESFTYKDEFDVNRDWALWAPIPFGPIELAADPLQAPSSVHWLGTDESGRDVAARLIYGAGISMKIGFISMGIALVIGLVLGAAAGYAGGWIDMLISRLIEIVMCFPTFFIILAIMAWLPPRIEFVMIVIGLTRWVAVARYARAEVMRLRQSDFAIAAKALGAGPTRIVFRHLLPNAMAPILVSATFGIASAVLIEAALSWLGFGVQAPQPSWGSMLRGGYENMFTASHMIPPACLSIFLAVLSFNLVGDTLRDVIDPRLHSGDL